MSEPVLCIFPEMSELIAFDYSSALPLGEGVEVDAAELEAHEWSNNRAGDDLTSSFLVSGVGTIVGNQVRFQFQNPPEGKLIRVKTKTEFSDGQIRVNRIFFEVKAA